MRFTAITCLLAASAGTVCAQTVDVGTGAPDDAVRAEFVAAFNRGSFSRLASLPPLGAVKRFGTIGLMQEFNDSTRSGGRLALVKSTSTSTGSEGSGNVYQVYTDVYTYYSSVGVSTAGYPTGDTQNCTDSPCMWQAFDRNYALFAWFTGANDPQNIAVRDPFYTRWVFYGGVARMGAAISAETEAASSFGTQATVQTFRSGALFSFSSGALSGSVLSVREPIRALYESRAGYTGGLGFPKSEERTLANGKRQQEFEGGLIEYGDNSPPVIRTPVGTVVVRGATSPLRLNAGESLQIEAVVTGTDGSVLTDRQVNFITSNGRVVSVQAAGTLATLSAVGGGRAVVTATSEGKSSPPLEVIVESKCCAVGEGAPSAAIQSAFQAAVIRTRIQVRLPGPEPVRRVASGYVQEFQGTDGSSRFVIAMSDKSASAWVVTGQLLERYEALGGTSSALGFPTSDATAGGRQMFERGALAGNPPRVVTGAILTRWASSGYEDGVAGLPTDEAVTSMSFAGTVGPVQPFRGAVIAAPPRGGILVSGAIAEWWVAAGGAEGVPGFPSGEETTAGGARKQEFEGGTAEIAEGATEVRMTPKERSPAVSANPDVVLTGGRVRLSAYGFPVSAVLRVSVTGQADFIIPTVTGAFTWEAPIAATASPGRVRVRAAETQTNAAAEGTYTIRAASEVRFRLAAVGGDGQSGAPGATLPTAVTVQLRDDSGSPVGGMTVRFTASPGARVSPATATTDGSGLASTFLTLPPADGVAVVTAEGGRQVVTFAARSAGASITSFPGQLQAEFDALVASLASVVRYYQTTAALGTPNGLATTAALGEFLRRVCVTDSKGEQLCDGMLPVPGGGFSVPNIWRVGRFVDGQLIVVPEKPDTGTLRAAVAGGSPLIIAMRVTSGSSSGSHFVVATGIANDGSIQIHDPDPRLGRTRLSEYTSGFDAGGQIWKGEPVAVLRVSPRAPARGAFAVMTWGALTGLASRSGECGFDVSWPARPVTTNTSDSGVIVQRLCEGTETDYQLDVSGDVVRASVFAVGSDGARMDVAGGGSATFRVSTGGAGLSVQPQRTTLAAHAVVNAASFTPDIAPGSLVLISGSGLARDGSSTRLTIGGRAATITAALPLQITAQIPPETAPGVHVVRVESPWGSAEQTIEVRPTAPAVFAAGDGWAIANPDGRLNSETAPVRRGDTVIVYGTGLGAVSAGTASRGVLTPVIALVRTQQLRVTYAGLAPGLIGIYQVNCVIPNTLAPGLAVPMVLEQGGFRSTAVEISIF